MNHTVLNNVDFHSQSTRKTHKSYKLEQSQTNTVAYSLEITNTHVAQFE